MDGSYLRPDGRGQPSLPSQSASTSAYKANVNRSKTKKWVEAKTQNYDGDDWGADEYDDDEDDELEPPLSQQRLTQDQLPSQRAVSQTQATYQSPSSTTAPPSQLQSYPPPTADATEPTLNHPPPATSPSEPEQPIVTPMVAAVPVPQTASADIAPTSDASDVERSANGKPLPFIRPSDIYKRMEAERARQRVSSDDTRPAMETVTDSQPTDHSPAPAAFTVEHPVDAGFVAPESSTNVVTGPGQVTPQKSTFDAMGSAARDNESKRISLSPKLPDLARMSVFGADFFSTTLTDDSAPTPPLPTITAVNDSKEDTFEPKTSLEQTSTAAVDLAAAEQPPEVIPLTTTDKTSQHEINREAVPPLQTIQEPHEDDADEQDFAPTEPLQLRKGDSTTPVFEPKPIARETTFGTDTSSPVKESDVLREEIMRSLSPVATENSDLTSASVQNTAAENGQQRQGTNDSAYTLKDYDSYWSEPNADTPPPRQAENPTAPSFAMETVPEAEPSATAPTVESDTVASKPTEDGQSSALAVAGVAGATAVGAGAVAAAATSQPEHNSRRRFSWEASSEPAITSEIVGVNDVPAAPIASGAAEEHSEPKVLTEGANAPSISVAPPILTTAAPAHQKTPSTDAPRASVVSDEGGAPIDREDSRLSLAEEKALAHESSTSLVAPSPPPESHPALAAPPLQTTVPSQAYGQPVLTFREIMELGSAEDRISKFNAARVSFATNEIGLHHWLATMQADHPEHLSRSATGYKPQVDTGNVAAGPGSQPAAQQPYYQQYLNASSPSSQSPTGRSRLAGLSVPSTGGSSAFGSSGNQLGTKGKEFMQSAGKMGKGLLSKGKFKLRGSGDKGETPPSPVQPKPTKADRRSSWALNLGPKLRTDVPSMQEPAPVHSIHPGREPEPAPRLPEYAPLSPFIADSEPEKTSVWAPPPIPSTFKVQESGEASSGIRQVPNDEAQAAIDDWVLVSPDIGPAVPSKSPIEGPPKNLQPRVVPEDSGIAMTANAGNEADIPQRQSSFIGLPPIRRSSTFGLSKAKKAKERFPLDAGDDEGEISGPWSQSAIPEQLQHLEADLSDDSRQADAKPPRAPAEPAASVNQKDTSIEPTTIPASQSPLTNTSTATQPTQHSAATQASYPHAQDSVQQSAPPIGRQAATQNPGQPTEGGNAIHRPPPVGPWKLEESYLSEPLNPVSRNRSGTGGSQSPVFYGFDKETGLPNPIPPPGPSGPPFGQLPSRPRAFDTPPSSAQRYPDLFAPRPGQPPQPGRPQGPGQYPPNMYRDNVVNPRGYGDDYEIAGVGPPGEERGRKKRNSGIFKDIGNKIARATSRERRTSFAEQRPVAADIRGDGASESSFGQEGFQEKKKRRPSFLQALGGGRASMDQGSERPSVSGLQRSQTEMNMRPDSQSERKKSFFSGLAAAQQKLVSGASRQSFSGTRPDESTEDVSETTPKKKRFSDISKVFRRSQQGESPERRRESLDATQVLSGPHGAAGNPMDLPAPGSGRSGTTGSFSAASYPDGGDDAASAKGRRGSASDFLSNLVGRRTGSRQGEAEIQPSAALVAPGVIHQQVPANLPPPPTQVLGARPGSGNGLAPAGMYPEGNQKRLSQHLGAAGPSPLAQQSTIGDNSLSHEETTQRRPLSYERQPDMPADFNTVSRADEPPTKAAMARGVGTHEQEPNAHVIHAAAPSISSEGTPVERSVKPAESFTTDTKDVKEDTRTERGDEAGFDPSPSVSDIRTSSVDTPVSNHRPSASFDAGGSIISRQDTNEPAVSATSTSASQPPRPVGNGPPTTNWSPYRPQQGFPQGSPQGPQQAFQQGPPQGRTQGPLQGPLRHPQGLVPGAQRGPLQSPPQGPHHGQRMPQNPMAPQQWGGQPSNRPVQGQHTGPLGPSGPPRPQGPNSYGSVNSNIAAGPGQYNPPYQQKGPTSPYEQQPAPSTSAGRPAEQGASRWKGIRNRMSEQMSNIAQSGNKEEKVDNAEKPDRLSGSKILGAFKRGSKQPEQMGQQAKPAFQPASANQSPLPSPPASNRPPSDIPSPRRVISMQQFQSQQVQGPRASHPEPQYDAVPIPQGYSAVHGEGNMVPTQYRVPRQMYQGQPQTERQIPAQYGMKQGLAPEQRQSQQAGPDVPQKDDHSTGVRSPIGEDVATASAGSPAQGSTGYSSPAYLEPETNLSREQSEADFLKPTTAPAPDTAARRSPSGRSQVSAMSTAPAPQESKDEKPDLSVNTDINPQTRKIVEAKTVESPPLHDAKLDNGVHERTEEPRPSTSATNASDKTEGPGKPKTSFAAELDDTEEARKRTLRLEAQEEKIHYDPQEDAEPQMSATSYPGDEWNPYGEVAFADWRDD